MEVLEIKSNTVTEKKNAPNGFIIGLDRAEEQIHELEERSKLNGREAATEQDRTAQNYGLKRKKRREISEVTMIEFSKN